MNKCVHGARSWTLVLSKVYPCIIPSVSSSTEALTEIKKMNEWGIIISCLGFMEQTSVTVCVVTAACYNRITASVISVMTDMKQLWLQTIHVNIFFTDKELGCQEYSSCVTDDEFNWQLASSYAIQINQMCCCNTIQMNSIVSLGTFPVEWMSNMDSS